MESKNYSISEVELAPTEAKKIMTKLLDAQINTFQLQSIQDWEKNRNNANKWKNEIERLKEFKQRLNDDITSLESSEELLKLNLSLGLDLVNQREIRKVS